jgi:hypothetical protein
MEYPLQRLVERRARNARSRNMSLGMLTGVSAGAALMYIFDPQQGGHRRALARDKLAHGAHVARDRGRSAWRDACQRSAGIWHEGRRMLRREPISDETLAQRVRAQLRRHTHYAHAIDVAVQAGRVTLSGPVLERDMSRLLRSFRRLSGVHEIDDQLSVHSDAGAVPALQGARDEAASSPAWTSAQRITAGAAGSTLLLAAMRRRGALGAALGLVGAGLLAAGMFGGRREAQRPGEEMPPE